MRPIVEPVGLVAGQCLRPATVLVLGKSLSGAVSSSAYLFSPWADQLGGAG